jgi:site-specific DNA-methyltransferase (adenine-specific)
MKGCGRKIGRLDCCTIIKGNCEEYLKRIPRGSVDIVMTDPPYGRNCRTHRMNKGQHRAIHGDDRYPVEVIKALIKVPRLASYFFCQWQNFWEPGLPTLLPEPTSVIAWIKPPGGTGNCQLEHMRSHELVLFYPQPSIQTFLMRPPDVVASNRTGNLMHPTQKPVELLMRMLSWHDFETVLDPYSGSGSTARAAKRMGKHFLAFEIDDEHYATSVAFVERPLVRKPAVLHNGQQPRLTF